MNKETVKKLKDDIIESSCKLVNIGQPKIWKPSNNYLPLGKNSKTVFTSENS